MILAKLNKLLRKTYFPVSLKYLSMIIFLIVIITGLSANSSDETFLLQLRNTNLGNLLVWSYWWPAIVIGAIFFGRIWCMVCPVEIISSLFARIGFKRKRPSWLLSGWAITFFYTIILFVGIEGYAIHRNPLFMAIYLLAITFVAIVIGLIFEKNTFCRYVCPIGYLLGLYARLSIYGWRVREKQTCKNCPDKSCIKKEYRYHLNHNSCGVDLYPPQIHDNADCILCAGCLKTCDRYQRDPSSDRPNPQFTHIGFANDLFSLKPLKPAEMIFVLIVSGFVVAEIWSEWAVTTKFLGLLPGVLISCLPISHHLLVGLLKALILYVLMPFALWGLPYVVVKLTGVSITLKDYCLTYGIAFIPIMASAHLSKAILKTTSRLPYIKYLYSDSVGISTAQHIIQGKILLPHIPAYLNLFISVVLPFITIMGIFFSAKVVTKINDKICMHRRGIFFYLIPIFYGSIFLFMIIFWRWKFI